MSFEHGGRIRRHDAKRLGPRERHDARDFETKTQDKLTTAG